jgi:hypothetical protein
MPAKTASPHAAAAKAALDHLDQALAALDGAFDHPHHTARLDQLEGLLANVRSVIEQLPPQEDNRADYAARLLADYKARRLPAHLPDHAETLLNQELERMA